MSELNEILLDLLPPDEQEAAIIADFLKSLEKRLKTFESSIENYVKAAESDLKQDIKSETEKAKTALTGVAINAQNSALGEIKTLLSNVRDEIKGAEARLESRYESKEDAVMSLLRFTQMKKEIEGMVSKFQKSFESHKDDWELFREELEDVKKDIKKKYVELISRPVGGGNQNRNIAIGGNSSVLSRYTDINIKPGNNVTLSYTNNDVTRMLDLTITSSGSGGSSRSISNIATSQAAGSATGTDYVYIASVGVQLTLPTVVGNSNLYTIKNTSTSSVLLSPAGADTIDNQSTIILATQYTSVDLISDGIGNWNIT